MSERELFLQSIKDFLTPKMLKFAIMPFLITLVVMYGFFFGLAGMGVEQLGILQVESTQTTMQNGVPHTESLSAQLEGSSIIKFLMSYTLTSWLATFLIYAIGGFLTIYLSVFIAVIVMGFLTPFVLKELQARHYRDVEMIGYSNPFTTLFLTLQWIAVMLFLFLLFIPLYFIPLLNIVAINIPLYYFFHKMLTFDVASTICTKEESRQIGYFSGNKIMVKTAGLYLLSLVPFVVFFTAVFFVIYLGHTYFAEVKKVRTLGL